MRATVRNGSKTFSGTVPEYVRWHAATGRADSVLDIDGRSTLLLGRQDDCGFFEADGCRFADTRSGPPSPTGRIDWLSESAVCVTWDSGTRMKLDIDFVFGGPLRLLPCAAELTTG